MSRTKRERIVSLFLTSLGLVALAVSTAYMSSILTFIGLGLIFWGILFLYITNEKYVKQNLLDSSLTPSLANLNEILTELDYRGQAIYLPSKYLKDSETSKIYIAKSKNTSVPTPEEFRRKEGKTFLKNPEAILIVPPGASLLRLFEKTLGRNFNKVNLEHLQRCLPKLFIEDLEIAENLELQMKTSKVTRKVDNLLSLIQFKSDTVFVRISNSIYEGICRETRRLAHICSSVGCPICSAIACAIAETSGKPVIIEKIECMEDGKVMDAYYKIIEE